MSLHILILHTKCIHLNTHYSIPISHDTTWQEGIWWPIPDAVRNGLYKILLTECEKQREIDTGRGRERGGREWGREREALWNSLLTLTLPGPSAGVSGSLDSYCSLKPLCSGMGEVVPARTSPTLPPPSPRTVLSLSCFKVSQCINCRDWHFKS